MSKNTKIIIIVAAVLGVLCIAACAILAVSMGVIGNRVAQSVKSSPQDVANVTASIAQFDLPEGFTPAMSMKLAGVAMAMYENSASDNSLVLLQMPTQGEVTEDNIRQMQTQMERQSGRNLTNLKTIETRPLTVRGKPATMVIQEGTSSEGKTYRQMLVGFQGQSGLAMLMAIGPAAGWDQATYDNLVASIR